MGRPRKLRIIDPAKLEGKATCSGFVPNEGRPPSAGEIVFDNRFIRFAANFIAMVRVGVEHDLENIRITMTWILSKNRKEALKRVSQYLRNQRRMAKAAQKPISKRQKRRVMPH